MKVMFMGTPDFAVPSLKALCAKHEVVCVVSQPDKPKGRGHSLQPTATKIVAEELGIPVEQPTILKDGAFLPILQQYQPELIVAAAYGKILPDYILEYPKFGSINVHGSLLPKYRGAAPIQWAILNGDAQSGVTIMHMAHEMDTGDIILMKTVDIAEGETSGELFDRLSLLGADALLEAIDLIEQGKAERTPQEHAKATYAPMLDRSIAALDFSMNARKIACFVAGLNPWPIAKFIINGQEVKVFSALCGHSTKAEPATVCAINKEGLEIACGDGNTVILKTLQRPGKKPTDGYSFAQGLRLKVGDKLN